MTPRISIFLKLLVPSAGLFLLFALLVTKQVLSLFAEEQLATTQDNALVTANAAAMMFDRSISDATLQRVTTTIALNDHVVEAVLLDPNTNNVLASSRFRHAKHTLDTIPKQLVNVYNLYTEKQAAVFSPVVDHQYALAYPITTVAENKTESLDFTLLVLFDTYLLDQQHASMTERVVTAVALLLGVLMIVLYAQIEFFVRKPLRVIESGLRRRTEQADYKPLRLNTKDEFADLAQEFNRMREVEKQSYIAATQARDEAEALAKKKAEFLANMSHELRTPINGVMGLAEMLKNTNSEALREEYTQHLVTSSKLLLAVVNDILDFTKLENAAVKLVYESVSLPKLLRETLNLVVPLAKEKGLGLHIHKADDVPHYVELDKQRVQQILINLLSNAIKFTHQGKVVLDVSFDAKDEQRGYLKMAVSDTGIGIAHQDIAGLFVSFEQADTTIARRYGGTGLGLAITKALAELMQGEIDVKSKVDVGSTFTLSLPVQLGESSEQDEAQTEKGAPLTGNILLAEDNDINGIVATSILEDMGHCVTWVRDGKQAIEALAETPFDIVLMDIQMPEVDGFAATRLIRLNDKHIPIIALSANVLEQERTQALDVGMDEYLHKPIDKPILASTLQRFLALRVSR